jgi:uncharacterized protein
MTREETIRRLKEHEAELKLLGVASLSLFGSTARDEATVNSDIDVVVKLDDSVRGFRAFGALDEVQNYLAQVLRARVDVVPEPTEPGPAKTAIDRDRCLAF